MLYSPNGTDYFIPSSKRTLPYNNVGQVLLVVPGMALDKDA